MIVEKFLCPIHIFFRDAEKVPVFIYEFSCSLAANEIPYNVCGKVPGDEDKIDWPEGQKATMYEEDTEEHYDRPLNYREGIADKVTIGKQPEGDGR